MKKNSKKSWLKNNILSINLLTIFLFSISFLISKITSFNFPINFFGFIWLLFITPLNILLIFHLKLKGFIEHILASLVIFFTIMTPFYFIANYLFKIPFTFNIILFLNVLIFIITSFFFYQKPKNLISEYHKKITLSISKKFIFKYWPLLSILFLYILLHLLNYHFYVFMPEWDGYTKLIETKNAIKFNTLNTNYRGFFTVAIILISKFTKIAPYTIFTSWFIVLQTTLILIMYKFIKIYNIKNKLHQFILLLSTLAIPVLNMEIDMTRPQNALIILLPIYLYFIYRAIQKENYSYWVLTTLIAILGLNYHEFFIFILFTHLIIIFTLALQKYILHNSDKKEKIIFTMSFIIIFLLLIIFDNSVHFLRRIFMTLNNILSTITKTENWRWWFLNNYSADGSGQQLGWPGLMGAIKYYSYYTSPLMFFSGITTIFLIIKKKLIFKNFLILKIITPILILLLTYSEILPRLGYFYLPERIWLIVDLLTLPFLIIIYKIIKEKYTPKIFNYFLWIILILNLIGISGSLYISHQKKALTSKNEFLATQWIKNNTPKDSLFITQGSGEIAIKYFAGRKLIPTPNNFFNTGLYSAIISPITPQQKITTQLKLIQSIVKSSSINNLDDIKTIILKLETTKKQIKKLKKESLYSTPPTSSELPIYAFYSYDKFKGLYAQREWWLKANYYGAKIEHLTKKYPLVYNKDGIYIWKIK